MLLPGFQSGLIVPNRPGLADKTFAGAVVSTTASATRTFAITLPPPGPKKLIVGYAGNSGVNAILTMALAVGGAGGAAGEAFTKIGNSVVQGGKQLDIWELNTNLGNAQTITVVHGANPGNGTAVMAYSLENQLFDTPFSRLEALGAAGTTVSGNINIPEGGVLLGFIVVGDSAPGSFAWNTQGEDSDATSTTHGWSSHSTEDMNAETNRLVQAVNTQAITDMVLIALAYR